MRLQPFKKSEAFLTFESGVSSLLYYLSDEYIVIQAPEVVDVAFNIYIGKITEINNSPITSLVGNTLVQTFKSKKAGKYKPTFIEKSLYFVV